MTNNAEAWVGVNATLNNVFNIAGDGTNSLDTSPRGALRMDAGTITASGSVVLTGDASIGNIGGAAALATINAVISETGGTQNLTFNKAAAGTGIIALGGLNNYSGTTSLGGGTLKLGVANALPSTTQMIFTNSSTLNLNSLADTIKGITINGGVTATMQNGSLTTTSATNSIVFTGSTSNLLTGGVVVLPSTAAIDASAMTGTGTTSTLTSQLSGSGGVTIKSFGDTTDSGGSNGARLILNNSSNASTLTGTIAIASGLVDPNANDANFGAAGNGISVTGGGFFFNSTQVEPTTRLISLSGSGDRYFRVTSGNTATINGVISGVSTANLRKTDGGTLVLGAANTYAGNTIIGSGTLQVGIASALPSTTQVIFSSSSTLNMNSLADTVLGVTVQSGVTGTITTGTLTTSSTSGSIVFTGTSSNTLTGGVIALPAGGVIDSTAETTNNVVATLTSQLSGSGAVTIKANGDTSDTGGSNASRLVLNNTNNATTLTGPVTISAGLVDPNGSDANLGQAGNTISVSGGGFYFIGPNTLPSSRGIALSGTGDRYFRVSNTNTTTINGVISGPATANLRKTDAGTLALDGTNTYAGATILGLGNIRLDVAGALGGGGNILFTGGTLQYTATNNVDYSGRIAGSTAAITIDPNGQTIPFAAALASTNVAGLTLNDTATTKGVLTLSAANLYSARPRSRPACCG